MFLEEVLNLTTNQEDELLCLVPDFTFLSNRNTFFMRW